MGIDWNMGSASLILFGIAWSLHHFKDSIEFGRFVGGLDRFLGVLRRDGGARARRGPTPDELKGRYERMLAAVVMLATGSAVIAAAGALGPVWAWAQANVLLLLGAGILLAIWVYHMMVRGNRHHVTRTTAIAALFGGVMALIWGGWTGLGASTGKALDMLRATSGQAIAGNAAPALAGHGHAAVAAGSGSSVPAIVLGTIAGLLLLIVVSSYRKENSKKKNRKSGRAGRAAAGGNGVFAQQ